MYAEKLAMILGCFKRKKRTTVNQFQMNEVNETSNNTQTAPPNKIFVDADHFKTALENYGVSVKSISRMPEVGYAETTLRKHLKEGYLDRVPIERLSKKLMASIGELVGDPNDGTWPYYIFNEICDKIKFKEVYGEEDALNLFREEFSILGFDVAYDMLLGDLEAFERGRDQCVSPEKADLVVGALVNMAKHSVMTLVELKRYGYFKY